METKVEERKNDLRNTTVLEVILAVIIILLCVVYIKDTENKTMEKNFNERITQLQAENETLKSNIRDLKKENRELKDEVERLNRKLDRYKPRKPGEEKLLENAELYIEELEKEIKKLNQNTSELEDKLKKLKPKNEKGKGGIDKPSCLIERGKIEYFANIIKRGNKFKFLPTGSSLNKMKVSSVPGASKLFAKEGISIEELQKFGKLAFTYGQNSTPSCVYYVKLDPNKWSGGELKKLERYFYKSYR